MTLVIRSEIIFYLSLAVLIITRVLVSAYCREWISRWNVSRCRGLRVDVYYVFNGYEIVFLVPFSSFNKFKKINELTRIENLSFIIRTLPIKISVYFV